MRLTLSESAVMRLTISESAVMRALPESACFASFPSQPVVHPIRVSLLWVFSESAFRGSYLSQLMQAYCYSLADGARLIPASSDVARGGEGGGHRPLQRGPRPPVRREVRAAQRRRRDPHRRRNVDQPPPGRTQRARRRVRRGPHAHLPPRHAQPPCPCACAHNKATGGSVRSSFTQPPVTGAQAC